MTTETNTARTTPAAGSTPGSPAVWMAALAGLFAFRLLYGLCYEFFFEDETQIFLIGLRAYAAGRWPFFGADVVWTQSQIPGALQGLLVSVPLTIAPYPEAPFVLLAALSMAAIALLAWYICLRLPSLPMWLVWGWLMTVPWTLNFSTSMINTSYILPGAAVFFVGFFEASPRFSIGRLPAAFALAMMGFGLGWVMQIHMSWPLLLPYAGLVLLERLRANWRWSARDGLSMAAGFAIPGLFLLPTLLAYGLHAGGGGTGRNVHVHFVNPGVLLTTAGRFLSFASLEVIRFMGTDTAKRAVLVARNPWLAPLLAVVWTVGILHPLLMLWLWFKRSHPARADWPALRALVAASLLVVYSAYFFVMEPPQAHAFYVLSPISMMFAGYCWSFVDSARWRKAAAVVLGANIAFHLGLALAMAPGRSMYKNRAVVAAAVTERETSYFAHRREYAMDAINPMDAQARRVPGGDLSITSQGWSIGTAKAILWSVTVRNNSTTHAFRDLLYQSSYQDSNGRRVLDRHGYVLDVVQPGESRTFEINDGAANVPFANGRLEFVLAEALRPLGR
jgi:hypothetical protein